MEGSQELSKAVANIPEYLKKPKEKTPPSTPAKLNIPQTAKEAASQVEELSDMVEKLQDQGLPPKKESVDKEESKDKYLVTEELIESLTEVYDIPREELKEKLDRIAEKTKEYESLSKLSQISLKMQTVAGEKLAKVLPEALEKLDNSSFKLKFAVIATMITTGLEIGIPGPFIINTIQQIVNALASL